MFSKLRLAAAALGLALSATAGFAQDVTRIKFTLDWKIQGIHAWYYWRRTRDISPPRSSTSPSTRAKARPRP